MAKPPLQPFSVGDRVVYRDPEAPRDPLAGEVVEVTGHAVWVRYDRYSATGRPGVIAAELAAEVLWWKEVDGLTPPVHRRNFWRNPFGDS